MAQRNQFGDISIDIPDAYKVSEGVAGTTSTRKRSGRQDDNLRDDVLLDALAEEHDLSVEKTVLLSRHRDYRKRSANAKPADTRVKVSVPAKKDEQAVILLEEDGVYRWVFPKQQSGKRSRTQSGGTPAFNFEIELAGYAHEEGKKRGIGDKVKTFAKKVKAHVIKIREGVNIASLTIEKLEKKVNQGVLNLKVDKGDTDLEVWKLMDSLSSLELPADRPPKVLLFIHGTFSSTIGSYGGLTKTTEGRSFLKHARNYYDLILGFDHYTLSVTPSDNALELLKQLKTVNWLPDHPPEIDAIGYSRGGLVLRSLVERELPEDGWEAVIRKAIFVGATNGGTELAKPENWYRFIDFHTNMAAASTRVVSLIGGGELAGPIFGGMIRGLGAFAKYLATSVSNAKIPGLSAMEPGGPFVTEINKIQEGQPRPENIDYYAVTSEFDIKAASEGPSPGIPKRMMLSLGGGIVDQLMGEPNDLVVNTASMTTIDPDLNGLVKQECAFGINGQVYHTVYFLQPATVKALHGWLALPGKIASSKKKSSAAKRSVQTTSGEPVVFEPVEATIKNPKEFVVEDTDRPMDEVGEQQPAPMMAYGGHSRERPKLKVNVHWDDITKVSGDAYAVGHYRGVEPQSAELAVDAFISGVNRKEKEKLVLTQLTRQGLLVGDIGQIDLFPCKSGSHKVAAVCGMGFFNGDFSEQNVQLLYRKLLWKLNTIPSMKKLCTVLIGSGVGSLDTHRALRGQLRGYADALAAFPDSPHRINEVRIVEYDKLKALKIHDHLLDISRQNEIELDMDVKDSVQSLGTGGVSADFALSTLLSSIIHSHNDKKSSKLKKLLDAYLEESKIKISEDETKTMGSMLEKAWKKLNSTVGEKASNTQDLFSKLISVELSAGAEEESLVPNRLSIRLQDNVYRIAGLTSSSAIPEREIKVDVKLVHELIGRMTDPQDGAIAKSHGKLLHQLLIPFEFEEFLTSNSALVFEVDRNTAPIHWEMLVVPSREESGAIGLTQEVSRQLRTTYSNMPSAQSDRNRRALVIGDPDGTLKFARDEAIAVRDLLEKNKFEVDIFIGSPDNRNSWVKDIQRANRLDVVGKLFEGKYAIVHYAGHGDYDKQDPSKTGWLFSSGLLTAGEIERLSDAPALIFANACLSVKTSTTTRHAVGSDEMQSKQMGQPFGEAGLLPSLADEVLKLGVRNYIGTAWEIADQGAVEFAKAFYKNFLPGEKTIGESMYEARKSLCQNTSQGGVWDRTHKALWAAYQHYGPHDYKINRS